MRFSAPTWKESAGNPKKRQAFPFEKLIDTKNTGVRVRPCYMYALTREGRKPPMVHVRQSIYSLLEPRKKKGNVVDILGFFAPLADSSELYQLLAGIGIKTVYEISRCRDLAEYKKMAEANFALVLNPEARAAAEDFEKKLGIPSIELKRFYDIERIRKQYRALGAVLGVSFDDAPYYEEALRCTERFRNAGSFTFSVGECLNADPFELPLALVKLGSRVPEIFGTLTAENFIYLEQLAALSPETKIYSNLHPSMLFYETDERAVTGMHITLGKDAGFYHRNVPNIPWNSDIQPYGYDGTVRLLSEILRAAGEETAS